MPFMSYFSAVPNETASSAARKDFIREMVAGDVIQCFGFEWA